MKKLEFKECDTCRAKPGSPILCSGCRHNREVINKYQEKLAHTLFKEWGQIIILIMGVVLGIGWGIIVAELKISL